MTEELINTVWFTSDLHLGNPRMARSRKFETADEAGYELTEAINKLVHKRHKLFLLGDIIDTSHGTKWAKNLQCQNIELILGNHDKFPLRVYQNLGWKIHGFRGYRDWWLSHCPIHPNEIGPRKLGNIHGHVHQWGCTDKIEDPRYFCVNPEFHHMQPVCCSEIQMHFKQMS